MSTPIHDPVRRGRASRGTTLVEITVFLAVIVPLMVSLASTVSIFSKCTTASHHRTNTNSENQRILQKIVAELVQTSTKLDHQLTGNCAEPQSESFSPGTTNTAYDYVSYESLHPIDALQANLERDGHEAWHNVSPERRFYICATFAPFDTIEYQKVLTPKDGSNINLTQTTVSQPWSPRRKIFLSGDTVYLRALTAAGQLKTVVLGTHVSNLKFHLNADGEIIIRLTTTSGRRNATNPSEGASLTTQVTVTPRNGLS